MSKKEKVIEYFFNNCYEEVYLRELAKKIKLSPFAIKKYCDSLIKENIIVEKRKGNLRFFKANIDNLYFRYRKIAYSLKEIEKYKIIEQIKDKVSNLSSIVLFGSVAKGIDNEKSDLDLLVIGIKKNQITIDYKKEVNIIIYSWTEWKQKVKIDKAFYYDIIRDGIALYGELPLI